MQIKTTVRYDFTPVKMSIIKKTNQVSCQRYKNCQGCGEKGTLVNGLWGNKLVQPLWKIVQRFLKKLKTTTI